MKNTFVDVCKEIVDIGKVLSKSKLVEGLWGNISARLDEKQLFAITPSGRDYDTLSFKDISVLDLDGKIKKSNFKPSSESMLHMQIYKARQDIKAIVHTHSIYATAFAVAKKPILPVVEDVIQIVGGQVDVAEYALPGTLQLANNAVVSLKDKNAVLLANHGLVACGRNLKEALLSAHIVEKTAMILHLAQKIQPNIDTISKEDIEILRSFYLEKYSKQQLIK